MSDDIYNLLDDTKETLDRVKYHGDAIEPMPYLEKLIKRLEDIKSYSVNQSDLDEAEARAEAAEDELEEMRERVSELEEELKTMRESHDDNE